jgi:hypothetical protein
MPLLLRAYQNRSGAPVVSAEITRTGAPLAYAPTTPSNPVAMPMSTLPEITACRVGAPPCV